jgi:ATP-dependent 26S proteasome regulatory subunit
VQPSAKAEPLQAQTRAAAGSIKQLAFRFPEHMDSPAVYWGDNMAEVLERLKVLINSSTPIVVMETVEEVRAVAFVRSACAELGLPTFEWTIADGLVRSGSNAAVGLPGAAASLPLAQSGPSLAARDAALNRDSEPNAPAIYNTREPVQALATLESMTLDGVFILKDFHRHMEDAVIVRRLRDVGQKFSANRRTVVITAPAITIPPELTSLVEYLEIPLPNQQRLHQIIEETFARMSQSYTLKRKLDAVGLDAMAGNLLGLTEEEAERAVSQALVARYALSPEAVTDVLEAKKELLRHSGMLQFVDVSETMASIGGLENLKRWLAQRRGAWDEAARAFGLEPPRGMVVLGVQGCGKSMCARAVAGEWKLPLVKFDSSAVFDKYIGETEKRIQKVFQVAESLSPCVLWIDELEKVFAGSGPDSASVDAGVSSRILAAFLSWMQDRKAPVFVAATCNNVTALPPELIRKGRFDELFFVDLPNQAERKAILAIQLARRKHNPAEFDLEQIARAADGYSGAEIDAALQSAMYRSFADKQALATQSLLQALAVTVPLSTTRAEEIEALREWARSRAVPASLADAKAQATPSK